VRTSTAKAALSLPVSLCAAKLLLPVVTRDTAPDRSGESRPLEGRNSLLALPLSIEVLGSEPTDPETVPEAADSDDGRERGCGSGNEASRNSCRSDLERDLLRRGFEDCFKELSMRP
jgi:hypothetical protein